MLMARAKGNNLTFYVTIDTRRFDRNIGRMVGSFEKTERAANRAANSSKKIGEGADKSAQQADKLNQKFSKTEKLVGNIIKGMRRLAAIYLGKMGFDALISTMDSLISTQNKLNYLNGQRLGSAGVTADGSGYSQMTMNATSKDMDKIFKAAQQSRMGYLDMADNVAKSLTLAGDAFDNNIDQAIKFQKIMSESYTIGGASAQQKASSMYQLIQALGSGRLQGDELRSVAEGAQIAYHQIEKYAQELYGTTDPLKKMASEGLITSDVVVDAIMQVEDEIDSAFGKTMKTFDQTKTMIKNEAVRAFEPVMQRMADFLNSERGEKLVNLIIAAIYKLAAVINWLFDIIEKVFDFCERHSDVLRKALLLLSPVIGVKLVKDVMTLRAAFLKMLGITPLLERMGLSFGNIGTKLGLITKGAMSGGGILARVITSLGVVGLLLGAIVAVCAIFSDSTEDFFGMLFGWLYRIGYAIRDVAAIAGNIAAGLFVAIKDMAVWAAENIKTVFLNAINWIVRLVIGAGKKMAEGLNVFGAGIDLNQFDKLNQRFAYRKLTPGSAVDFSNVDKWATHWKVHDPDETYAKGYKFGAGLLGNKKSDGIMDTVNDYLANAVGASTHTNDTAGTDPATKALQDTADNTGEMAGILKQTTDDLTYLRKVAELEWKRDYTNYNIEIEMNNNNTITKEADVNSITNALAAKLTEVAGNSAAGLHY